MGRVFSRDAGPTGCTAAQLRREISARNLARSSELERETSFSATPSVIYREDEAGHGNFLPASWKRIAANPLWRKRLTKVYTASRYVPRSWDRRRGELECANSSDALLMNIFCYPGILARPQLCALLGISPGSRPEFGFRPAIPRMGGHVDRTEIDMRVGELLIEAKLTEGDFQRAPKRMLARYCQADEVFDSEQLPIVRDVLQSWQLVRGVLAAHACSAFFLVFCDRRRPDLTDRWFEVMRAVKDSALRTRLGILTWQEISATLPDRVRNFLDEKYGIRA
jgi:hypothetical protein